MNERDREGETMQGGQVPAGQAGAGAAGELGVNSAIGRRLKAFYDDVAGEPVPDRFLSLLEALDRAEQSPSAKGGEQKQESA